MSYINTPNTPNKRSSRVILDCRAESDTVNELKRLSINICKSYKSDNLLEAVASHPDMTILHIGGNKFICSPDSYEHYKQQMPDANLIKGSVKLKKDYPYDISYNITFLGENVFLNPASNQIEILKLNQSSNRKILNVNQGYTKCNICIINSNAIITSDKGIYKTAIKNQIDALLIKPGYIELKGMNYGFIGGATGLIAPDVLALNGELKTHPDGENINAFCKNHRIDVISLKKGVISDIGSIIPIN